MTDLSPQARAVLDAMEDVISVPPVSLDESPVSTVAMSLMAAAALRAAVDQVLPEEPHAPDTPDYPDDVTIKPFYLWLQRRNTRHELLAIAAELENHQ